MKPSELGKELKRVGSVATEKEMNGYMQKLSMDAFRDLVMFSAVDTGFLRSNWDVTTGNPGNAILHDIEGKRIVVIDHQQHFNLAPDARVL